MKQNVFVFDPTVSDKQSQVRGVGRYLQILKENFPNWTFSNKLQVTGYRLQDVFINPFFNLFQPPLVMRRIARKQIAVIHDLIPLKYPSRFPIGLKGKINVFLNKLVLNNYETIVTDSNASKKDIVQILGIDENKIRVIYPCLPKVFTHPYHPFSKEDRGVCLYVGDATWNKNLVNLAKAIKIINVTCVFVGKVFETIQNKAKNTDLKQMSRVAANYRYAPNYSSLMHLREDVFERMSNPWQQEFREFLREAQDDKRFIFEGFVDDYRLLKLYQQTKVNILPSRDEGFGFSYLEAASQSCPSVLSNIPILREISGEQAFFANPDDPHDIADKIGEIYFNDGLRRELGSKAKKRSDYFSQERFKKDFSKLWI